MKQVVGVLGIVAVAALSSVSIVSCCHSLRTVEISGYSIDDEGRAVVAANTSEYRDSIEVTVTDNYVCAERSVGLNLEICAKGDAPLLLHRWSYEVTNQGLRTNSGLTRWNRFSESAKTDLRPTDTVLPGDCGTRVMETGMGVWRDQYRREVSDRFRLDHPGQALKWTYSIHDANGNQVRDLQFYAVDWKEGKPWPVITGYSHPVLGHRVEFELSLVNPLDDLSPGDNDSYRLVVSISRTSEHVMDYDLNEWQLELQRVWVTVLSDEHVVDLGPPRAARENEVSKYFVEDIAIPHDEDSFEMACEVILWNRLTGETAMPWTLKQPLMIVSPRYFLGRWLR